MVRLGLTRGIGSALASMVAPGLVLLLATLLAAGVARAAEPLSLPALPPLTARVIDTAGVLPAERRAALEAKLEAFERAAGPQIVILTVPTTAPEDLTDYTQRLGDAWKLGRKEVGDGLLIVVAVQDRRVRIATAKALEGAVPDLAARQIIRDQIGPAFKQGDYATGLDRAVEALMARIRGENLPAPAQQPSAQPSSGGGGLDWESLSLLLFIGVPVVGGMLSAALGRKLGSGLTALGTGAAGAWLTGSVVLGLVAGLIALVMVGVMGVSGFRGPRGGFRPGGRSAWGHTGSGAPPVVIWGGGGSSGGSWGGGGGGGFSSGGGGDFGGGGASGDW